MQSFRHDFLAHNAVTWGPFGPNKLSQVRKIGLILRIKIFFFLEASRSMTAYNFYSTKPREFTDTE